jgi:aminoglycoside phosphotransferase (APT) family kinase protein
MMADIARRPWRVGGDRLAHFDLHPENVLLSPRGPVVIDWSTAGRGDAADDVAFTWVILATSAVPGPLPFRVLAKAGRDLLVKAFLAGVDADAARERVSAAARLRLDTDPHLLDRERAALARMIESGTVEQT